MQLGAARPKKEGMLKSVHNSKFANINKAIKHEMGQTVCLNEVSDSDVASQFWRKLGYKYIVELINIVWMLRYLYIYIFGGDP